MKSPFQFGKTVTDSRFTDRIDYLASLKNNMESGNSTILISPRRWGKSSLVKKCMQDFFLKDEAYRVVMIDLFRIRTEEEFYVFYANAIIKAVSSQPEEFLRQIKSFFKRLTPKVSLSSDNLNEISLSFDQETLKKNNDEILDLPERIAKKKNLKVIVCIDEFQNLEGFHNSLALQREFRSVWQNHKHVTYCLYGSKRHLMNELFSKKERPFYRFGDVIFLNKISKEDWIPFICNSFSKTGKAISSEFAGRLATLMNNHPFYVQQLCHIVWTQTETEVTESIINNSLETIVFNNLPFLMNEYEQLSTSQVNLLKAICDGKEKLNSQEVLREYHLGTSGNVSKNKTTLVSKDIINIINGNIEWVDPVFEMWFRSKE